MTQHAESTHSQFYVEKAKRIIDFEQKRARAALVRYASIVGPI